MSETSKLLTLQKNKTSMTILVGIEFSTKKVHIQDKS